MTYGGHGTKGRKGEGRERTRTKEGVKNSDGRVKEEGEEEEEEEEEEEGAY